VSLDIDIVVAVDDIETTSISAKGRGLKFAHPRNVPATRDEAPEKAPGRIRKKIAKDRRLGF